MRTIFLSVAVLAVLVGACGDDEHGISFDARGPDAAVSDAAVVDAVPPDAELPDAHPDPTLADLCAEDGGYWQFTPTSDN